MTKKILAPHDSTKAQHGYVYVLGSLRGADRRTYVGWCVDLEQRLAAHNSGRGARSTRGRAWVLLYAERFAARREAMSREVSLKRDRKFRAQLAKALAL
ncbi:MAG: GIY-YIG nuclease family protein [Caulobacterales bacterium]|jgi:putative endonuclease|nr:GIY-YIG nuclease family protein [Caulobacterales bacterium]